MGLCGTTATGGGSSATGGGSSATGGGSSATGGGSSATGGGSSATGGGSSATGGGSSATGGGATDGGAPFVVTSLDNTTHSLTPIAMAVEPALEHIGIAYFAAKGTQTIPGTDDLELRYLDYKKGVLTGPEAVKVVQSTAGLALQFDPDTHQPTVAYLGGGASLATVSWFQSDAVFSRRTAPGVWAHTTVATKSNDVTCGNPVSENGDVVGAWPALVFDQHGTLVFAYRDVHNGQYPTQDWAPSDVEVWVGTPTALTGSCAVAGGNSKSGAGGHLQLVQGANGPVLAYDQMYGNNSTGSNVLVTSRTAADGGWTAPVSVATVANTQSGPSLAFDSVQGLGVAAIDRATDQLRFFASSDGATWQSNEVFGAGSGGWYPSLAMDPVFHEPAIAFYVCSPQSGVSEAACSNTDDELDVTQRIAGNWVTTRVDLAGGLLPKLGFFASGKRFVVYRQPPAIDSATGKVVTNAGELKLAIER